MSADLPLRCRCGTLTGRARDVAPPRGLHLICHCRDCQAFAHYLERVDVLDDWGGTAVVQIPPARVELSAGAERLACMRLSETGLMRWYAGCCNTPVANTLANPGVPFAGVLLAFVDPSLDADARAAALGPARARVNASAKLRADPRAPKIDRFPARVLARSVLNLASAWRRKQHWPTPFYDADGEPRATPTILSEAERDELDARVDAR